jgi:uncharacterized Tic20 family protein
MSSTDVTPTPPAPDRPDPRFQAEAPPARREPIDDEEDAPREVWPPQQDRSLALWCHLGGFFTWVLVPLLILTTGGGKSRFVDEHAKEALNFQITLTIYYLVGCIIFPVVMVYELVVVILASMAASRGARYRIPLNIRFIK